MQNYHLVQFELDTEDAKEDELLQLMRKKAHGDDMQDT